MLVNFGDFEISLSTLFPSPVFTDGAEGLAGAAAAAAGGVLAGAAASSPPDSLALPSSLETITVNSPGVTNVIIPPHMHMRVEALSSVGMLPSITVAIPGTHGD